MLPKNSACVKKAIGANKRITKKGLPKFCCQNIDPPLSPSVQLSEKKMLLVLYSITLAFGLWYNEGVIRRVGFDFGLVIFVHDFVIFSTAFSSWLSSFLVSLMSC